MRNRKMKKETNVQVIKDETLIWIYGCLKNAKLQQPHLVDMKIHNAYHKWLEISSAAGRAKSYKSTSAKQLNVLVNIFHRKTPRANIFYKLTIYTQCAKEF